MNIMKDSGRKKKVSMFCYFLKTQMTCHKLYALEKKVGKSKAKMQPYIVKANQSDAKDTAFALQDFPSHGATGIVHI